MKIATIPSAVEVGVRDLKNNLSSYLHQVQNGADFIVTDRGKPVARLGPSEEPIDKLAALVAAGIVRRPVNSVRRLPKRRIQASGSVSEFVDDQRR